jgi:hypothetical protein
MDYHVTVSMKQLYCAGLLGTQQGRWQAILGHFGKKKMVVSHNAFGVCLAWSSVKSAMFHLRGNFFPDCEEGNFQGFANNKVNKSEITKLMFQQYMKMSMKKT